MSHLLEQLEGRERREECLRNDALNGEPLTCWGLSSFCAEVGHKCRAAGKCVYTPPESPAMRSIREAGQADAQAVMRSTPRTILRARSMNQTEQEK